MPNDCWFFHVLSSVIYCVGPPVSYSNFSNYSSYVPTRYHAFGIHTFSSFSGVLIKTNFHRIKQKPVNVAYTLSFVAQLFWIGFSRCSCCCCCCYSVQNGSKVVRRAARGRYTSQGGEFPTLLRSHFTTGEERVSKARR